MDVQSDPGAFFTATSAEVGGVDDGRAPGIELCHESVAETAAEGGLGGTEGRGEGGRIGGARNIVIAGGVHSNPLAGVAPAAAEERGVDEAGAGGMRLRPKERWTN